MALFREGDRVADRVESGRFGTVVGTAALALHAPYGSVTVRWDGDDGLASRASADTLRLVRWEDGLAACGQEGT